MGGILLFIACSIMAYRREKILHGVRVTGKIIQSLGYRKNRDFGVKAIISFQWEKQIHHKKISLCTERPRIGMLFDVYVNPKEVNNFYVDTTMPVMIAWFCFSVGIGFLLELPFADLLEASDWSVLVFLAWFCIGYCWAVFVDSNRKIEIPETQKNNTSKLETQQNNVPQIEELHIGSQADSLKHIEEQKK